MKARLFCTIAFLGLLVNVHANEDMRVWTNVRGHKIKAALVEIKDTTVILKSAASGKDLEIAITQLSHADRVFVQQQRTGQNNPKPGQQEQQSAAPEQRSYTQEQIDQIRDYDLLELHQQYRDISPNTLIHIEFDRVENFGGLTKADCYWAFIGESKHHVALKDQDPIALVVCADEGKSLLEKWRQKTERTKRPSEKAGSMELLCVILPKGHDKRSELADYDLVLMALGQDTRREPGGRHTLTW